MSRETPRESRGRAAGATGTPRAPIDVAQGVQLAGVVAAVVLAGSINVLAARHFARWDWTRDRRWSLSPATLDTLRGLRGTVDVWAIAGPGDPFEPSLRQLLAGYAAASSRLSVHWIDPDRDTAQLVDLQRRFRLEAGRADDGRVATDAIVIVATGSRHWFLTPSDMFEQSDPVHVQPREERALTQALRGVLSGETAKLCFTVGHGELSLDPEKDDRQWLGGLRDLLEKDNYELARVDATVPAARAPFAGCSVVVIAGARSPFAPREADLLRDWLLQGGSLLAAVGPMEADTPTGLASAGLQAALAPFGIALDDDLVHDLDGAVAIPGTHGEGFFVQPRPHPVTASLTAAAADAGGPRTAFFFTRSLRHVSSAGAAMAADLLTTTGGAFAKTSIVGAAQWNEAPPRDPGDPGGPFAVAMASERPRVDRSAAHGPRVVVLGSRFALAEDNWTQPRALHGTAFLVDSAISWLAAKPPVIDVPARPSVTAGIRVSEESRDEVRRYVLVWMPLAGLLLGAAVWAWRKSSEDRPHAVRRT